MFYLHVLRYVYYFIITLLNVTYRIESKTPMNLRFGGRFIH